MHVEVDKNFRSIYQSILAINDRKVESTDESENGAREERLTGVGR